MPGSREIKSPKRYIGSIRDKGAFFEAVMNEILSVPVDAIEPRFMRLAADFNLLGALYTRVVAEHRAPGWAAPQRVNLP